jgi:hypothetical protein
MAWYKNEANPFKINQSEDFWHLQGISRVITSPTELKMQPTMHLQS